MVKVCVLFAAGTNCDEETAYAFRLVGAEAETVHINRLKQRERSILDYHILAIPGGFSYGDYIASGRILANEIRHNLAEDVAKFIADGRLIIGICNGFQVLVKAGLLPAFERPFEPQSVTLDTNDSNRYEDRWVWLRNEGSNCAFTRNLPELIYLPVAHAEGKFIVKNSDVLQRLNERKQVVFRYVDANGQQAYFPDNPNGSVEAIAGICDPTGRVFGLMPHPERNTRREHHPNWRRMGRFTPDGIALFSNAVEHVRRELA